MDVIKSALTREDIDTYDLPPIPTKGTDSRSEAFVAKHGDIAVELDALPVEVRRARLMSLAPDAISRNFFRYIKGAIPKTNNAFVTLVSNGVDMPIRIRLGEDMPLGVKAKDVMVSVASGAHICQNFGTRDAGSDKSGSNKSDNEKRFHGGSFLREGWLTDMPYLAELVAAYTLAQG